MDIEDRKRIVEEIVRLSDGILSCSEGRNYYSLKVGDGPKSLAATVHKDSDRISFFIPSSDLLGQLRAMEFKFAEATRGRPRSRDWYRSSGLTLSKICENEDLFKQVVHESVNEVKSRQAKRKIH